MTDWTVFHCIVVVVLLLVVSLLFVVSSMLLLLVSFDIDALISDCVDWCVLETVEVVEIR